MATRREWLAAYCRFFGLNSSIVAWLPFRLAPLDSSPQYTSALPGTLRVQLLSRVAPPGRPYRIVKQQGRRPKQHPARPQHKRHWQVVLLGIWHPVVSVGANGKGGHSRGERSARFSMMRYCCRLGGRQILAPIVGGRRLCIRPVLR